ncbi:uncharacterized protein [Physcomitrium patens]|uniref:N-alpha-acetyltransferase 40 n=1 Tax=Physcomitrium patens TaxID=3218 RepID=A0A2K1J3W8_PHYPA|nr:N-alpha-acetyltransferase 40-like isoform X1 [Physcomitrium patens]XP_024401656.1 N-alpha-acetyltransferase 40-like isoform X1 [Physcomitrium patens]PNR36227.1 hypothetical protein PHYPA_022078 [Physcomitrium patens]|eukprot:XP_024401655.1 N-alpha-acetyltransferase 40-like isoform X1 [Physcomitrella patens]
MDRKKQSSKEKKLKRKEELAKKQSIDEFVRVANAKAAPIEEFPSFLKYERNGLNLIMEAGRGDSLSPPVKQYVQTLLKVNMEEPYGPEEWPAEEKNKRREMVSPDARYIFVKQPCSNSTEILPTDRSNNLLWKGEGDPIVAFVHYRFVVEHEVPALYVYEIQVEQAVQGKGLGKFLMQFLELIARKNGMKAMLLTLQKRNVRALAFYTGKLRFKIAAISPSRWANTLIGAAKSYEILCKTFDPDAKSILEDGN